MTSYLVPIKTAIFIFPLIAFLFTIPFILHQYHKYGSIHKLRVLIIYSFILYMITIYFLVILPLPKINEVVFKENMIRLVPFGFIRDFIEESSFVLNNPSTYLKVLTEPSFYTVAFNILMTIPFGMYLRYYFKCSFKKVILYSFLLSLFFELTQATGLYFIYKYPYRVFDVDDLMMNTLGGMIGYFVMGIIDNFLPTREEMDRDSLKEGKKVSGLRRITLFGLDTVIALMIGFCFWFVTGHFSSFLLIEVVYYIVIPAFLNQTIGGKFLNVKLEYEKNKIFYSIFRILFLYSYYYFVPIFLIGGALYFSQTLNMNTHEAILFYFFILCMIMFYFLFHFIYLFKNSHIYYDRFFKVTYQSTILYDESKEIQ